VVTIHLKQYVPVVLFVAFVVLSFFIVKPLLIPIFLGGLFAFTLSPLYHFFNKRCNKSISALLVCLLVLIVLLVPGLFFVKALVNESYVLFVTVKQKLAVGFFSECENTFCTFIEELAGDPEFSVPLKENLRSITNWVIEKGSHFLIRLPAMILSLFVTFFTMFYFLKDGQLLMKNVQGWLGIPQAKFSYLVGRLKEILGGVVYGYLLIALIQGAFGALGFFLFGVSSPFFWGAVMAFLALIPYLGTGIIWAPAAIFIFLDGVFQNSTPLILKGIGLFLYCLIFVASLDNLLRPKLIGDKARVHPVIILVGILGGIALFGVIGVLVGPLILSLTSVLVESYLGKDHTL